MGIKVFIILGFLGLSSLAYAGVKVIELPTPGSGVIYFRTMVRAGSMHDPKGKEGLAMFTAGMLKRGTEKYSRDEIANRLDQIGADLDYSIDKEFTVIAGRCLSKTLEPFYEIYSQVATAANFPQDQIEPTKSDLLAAIQLLTNDNTELGHEAFNYFLYRGTSWEHAAEGRISSVKSFSRQDVLEFYKTHYVQPAITIGVAGDYPHSLVKKLQADFGRLPSMMFTPIAVPHPTLHGRKVLVVEKEGLEQGQINIGHPLDVMRKDADYPALYLAIRHLGDHRSFVGQLMHSIRADRGLTYGAYAYMENFPYPYSSGPNALPRLNLARSQQDFRIWTFTLEKNMDFTIRLALLKLAEFIRQPLSQQRFQEIKQYCINKTVFQSETVERRLANALDDLIYHTDDFTKHIEKRLNQVRYQQLQPAIKQHIHEDDLAIVVTVPQAKKFIAQLLSPGAQVEYQGAIDPKPLAAQDNEAKALDLKIKAEQIETIAAAELFR